MTRLFYPDGIEPVLREHWHGPGASLAQIMFRAVGQMLCLARPRAYNVRYVVEVADLEIVPKRKNPVWEALELGAEILVEQDSERVHRSDLLVKSR